MKVDTVAIVSGGLDSSVLLHYLQAKGKMPLGISFDYGQRHRKELGFAERMCRRVGAPWMSFDLSHLSTHLTSSLTGAGDIPEGHYAADNMRSTVVPNRNAIMLAIAFGIAASLRATAVATGVHAGDHPVYPDCRPEFLAQFEKMQALSLAGIVDKPIRVWAPFVRSSKADIVRTGVDLGVPFVDTWSCYKGGIVHCGGCGTCVERYEAFKLVGVADPTVYENDPRVHLQEA